ncbi:hypothetical protein K450DRAFT_299245 [Umbelopsis ramanniana AG]|uniref:Endoglycoceramidase n=1 Tax=Umbelopsis ramanniana AG TaxID=1314678 RepID=A0AAD5HG70_UMBRA|nr:uncharacterized protein K450DRAFT_299245 [Umbelopsis ramanniana AG]KAI8580743.1 hypothetical protein K450DRAFT_299245 [Umbelopsis ramanniana AG]
MKLSSTNTLLISTVTVVLNSLGTVAVDPQGWYAANPGLSKIGLVDQSINQITDVYGRIRFFHGTNVVMKSAPWYRSSNFDPPNSFGLQDVQNLQALGVNVVRLGHHWAGAEPVRGQYNQTFLDIMKSQTQLAEAHGIYILVDVHQDVLAGQFCGHGVPNWFVQSNWVPSYKKFPVPQKIIPFATDSNGMPSASDCGSLDWSVSYLTAAVCNAFGRLYNNYDNLGDSFASYWKKLAQQYVTTNNILGYNLLNEPWVGDSYANPSLLVPGVADHVNLEGLWNKAATQIRTVDNNTLIFFEGTTYDILSGFNNVPLGDGSRSVQSYHYYKPPQVGTIEDTFKNRIQDNQRLKTASVLTEHTMWMGDSTQMTNIQFAVDKADQYMMSWMGWAYENLYNSTQQPYPELAAFYSRAYPSAIAGTPTSFHFNSTDKSFALVYKVKKAITAPTEIVLPTYTYPQGYNVAVTPANSLVQFVKDSGTLSLFTADTTADGQTVSVTITKQ